MSEKHDLDVLFSMLERPTEEFMASIHFKNLEKEYDVIKRIEPFGLPEVKKLICCSDLLSQCDWAAKYAEARNFYLQSQELDVLNLLFRYQDAKTFEEKILNCVDGGILAVIYNYLTTLTEEKNSQKKERSTLKGKITKAKNKVTAEGNQETVPSATSDFGKNVNEAKAEPTTEIKTDDEIHLEILDKAIEEKEHFLRAFDKHYSKVQLHLKKESNLEEMDAQRQKAYAAIDEIKPPREEEFLIQYISDGVLTEEAENELRNNGFLQRLLECLGKNSYKNVAFPVLAKLYSDGAIDLECNLIEQFIQTHNRMLAEYLEDQYTGNAKYIMDSENRSFIEYAIKESLNGVNDYVTWWNSIKSTDDWKYILEVSSEIQDEPVIRTAVKLMHHVYGTSMDSFMELISADENGELKITPGEFISEFLGQEAPEQKDLIRGYIRIAEQTTWKLQRRLASKERDLNRYRQDLFSSVYLPIEQLEELAVNLRLSDGKIKCSLVADHVISALASLREGLAAMGLETADDIETWQRQSLIVYDPEKHRMTSAVSDVNEKVKLQTLGYSYTDDEGNQKVRAAEVYIPAPLMNTTNNEMKQSSGSQRNHAESGNNRHPQGGHNMKKKGYPKGGSIQNNNNKSKQKDGKRNDL